MRISFLSRSSIATASLALTSLALAAVPADAATASGITRDQVLIAAASVRAEGGFGTTPSPSTARTLRVLANRTCTVDFDSEAVLQTFGLPTQAGASADGLMVVSLIADLGTLVNGNATSSTTVRACIFGALATQDPTSSLSGTATFNYKTQTVHQLSGDVYVTPARSVPLTEAFTGSNPTFTATGNATKTVGTKVATPKTTKQKKAAKKAQAKALKSAKKAYTKALKKAGDNKKKKSAAKKAYAQKKATANAQYKAATATFKIVNTIESRPFSVSAVIPVS